MIINNFDWSQIKHRADGQWPSILSALAGLDDKQLRNKHSSCPNCGGTDRYRFDDKQGTGSYFCNQCGAGDGLSLLVKCSGMSFSDSVNAVGNYLMLDHGDQKRVYTKPKPVKRIVSTRKNDHAIMDISVALEKFEYEPITKWTARNRIKEDVLYNQDAGLHLFPVSRAGSACNALFVDDNGVETFFVGGMTNGGYHRINKDQGKSIFFCVNIIDAHLTAQFTKSECVCVFEFANLADAIAQYKEDFKPTKNIAIAINNNENELILAEELCLVIMPLDSDDIATSSGFHKKLFNPTEVLDNV